MGGGGANGEGGAYTTHGIVTCLYKGMAGPAPAVAKMRFSFMVANICGRNACNRVGWRRSTPWPPLESKTPLQFPPTHTTLSERSSHDQARPRTRLSTTANPLPLCAGRGSLYL